MANIPPQAEAEEACSKEKPLTLLGVYLYCKLPMTKAEVAYSL